MNTPTTFKQLLYSMSLDTWVVAECAAEVDALADDVILSAAAWSKNITDIDFRYTPIERTLIKGADIVCFVPWRDIDHSTSFSS